MSTVTTEAVSESFQEVATAASDGSIKAGTGMDMDGPKPMLFQIFSIDLSGSTYLGVNYRAPDF